MVKATVCAIVVMAALVALPAVSAAGIAVQEKPAAKPAPYFPPELEGQFQDLRGQLHRKTPACHKATAPVPYDPCGPFAPNSSDPYGFGPGSGSYDFTLPGMYGWVWLAGTL